MSSLIKHLAISLIFLVFSLYAHATKEPSLHTSFEKIYITKIDSTGKGLADTLVYANSHITVAIGIQGKKISEVEIQGFHHRSFVTVKYKRAGEKIHLTHLSAARQRFFYNESLCSSGSDSIGTLGDLLGPIQETAINLDQSCERFPELNNQMAREFQKIVSKDEQKEFYNCLKPFDLIAASQWRRLPSSLVKISCIGDKVAYNGIFDIKKNKITISNACVSKKLISPVLKEELLHSFGITEEDSAKCLAKCPSVKEVQKCSTDKNKRGKTSTVGAYASATIDGVISDDVADSYNSAKTIEVPREIAMAQVPEPQVSDLKMTHSVETFTISEPPPSAKSSFAGSSSASGTPGANSSAAAAAYSYPHSLMQFAATAVLPERAYAQQLPYQAAVSADRAASSALAKSNSPSSSAEAYALAKSRSSGSRSPASENPRPTALASTSVKEVSVKNAEDNNSSAELGKSKAMTKSARSIAGHSAVHSSSQGSASASGMDSFSNSTGSASSGRGPASTSSSSFPANLNLYFNTAPYHEIKERLRDPQFVQELKRNSTTVFDAQGHRYGAPQGQSIYSDKGNRFVREK